MSRSIVSVLAVAVMFGAYGCGSSSEGSTEAEIIDLDKVLDSFHAAMNVKDAKPAKPAAAAPKPAAAPTPAPAAAPAADPAKPADPAAKPADPAAAAAPGAAPAAAPAAAAPPPAPKPKAAEVVESADKTKNFLGKFKAELNKRGIGSKHTVSVLFEQSGRFEGYADKNKNNKKDAGEAKLFWLEVDSERNRLIATTWVGGSQYNRPRGYRPGLGTGLLGGYMLGRMMGRSNRWYTGSRRPNYRSMKMAPKNYRSSARKSARGARSKGGSKGFRGGK